MSPVAKAPEAEAAEEEPVAVAAAGELASEPDAVEEAE